MAARSAIVRFVRNEALTSPVKLRARSDHWFLTYNSHDVSTSCGYDVVRKSAWGRPSLSSSSVNTTWRTLSTVPDPQAKRGKKSPHSKLLRVCSERNANSHFAAIEADLIRLDWKESMDALVDDWLQSKRFDNFVDLEQSVRKYVQNNLIDLKHDNPSCVREWERGSGRVGGQQQQEVEEDQIMKNCISLSDHLRFHHFPYERVANQILHYSLSGVDVLSPRTKRELMMDDGNSNYKNNKLAIAEIHERMRVLSKAGNMLELMTSFDSNSGTTEQNLEGGEEGTISEVGGGWSVHHTACSNVYKSVVSGWFLLYRRLKEANRKMLEESNAADIINASAKLHVYPEQEAYIWAMKWIDFCTLTPTVNISESQEGKEAKAVVLLGGIASREEPLLRGVAKILSMTENAKRQDQSRKLDRRLNQLFS